MIKQFKNGNPIQYTFKRSGEARLSVSNNISGYVFSGTQINNIKQYLTDVESFASEVRVLSANAFRDCNNLTNMTLFDTNISSVGSDCFRGCTSLSGFFIGKEQRSIPQNCFYGDSKLKFVGFKKYESDKSQYDA